MVTMQTVSTLLVLQKLMTYVYILQKDKEGQKSLFTRIAEALAIADYDTASKLQMEMNDKMEELEAKYANYSKNIF